MTASLWLALLLCPAMACVDRPTPASLTAAPADAGGLAVADAQAGDASDAPTRPEIPPGGPRLVLQPVTLEMIGPAWWYGVSLTEVRVLLRRDGQVVLDAWFAGQADTVDVGPVPAGSYELAAVMEDAHGARFFVVGRRLLAPEYNASLCDAPNAPSYQECAPVTVEVAADQPTLVPLTMICDMPHGVADACGGG